MKHLLSLLLLSTTTLSFSQVAIGIRFSDPITMTQAYSGVQTPQAANVKFGNFFTFINAGGFLRIPLHERWALQTEAIYSVSRLPFTATYDRQEISSRYDLTYLDIPILLQYEGKKPIRGFIQVGFSPKILLYREKESFSRSSVLFGSTSNFKNVIAMAHIGGGLLFERRHWIFTVDARLSASLSSVANYERRALVDMSNAHFYHFTLSNGIAYKF